MNVIIQFGRFGLVGLLNTFITLIVIAVLTWLGASPFVANAIGYGAGLVNSYFGNMKWTFKSDTSWRRTIRFLVAFGICYAVNVYILHLSLPLAQYQVLTPQLIAMASYTVLFFILSRAWVFKK
ncbi:GtrA family protein [Ochrobactrum soli]|uniref:GtrA family protein n=1 Tax=Brucella/Ochrobactrum group TaxID=2826938 RepID=UPI000EF1FA1D|nr:MULTISPECIES: GtrA family protein [Brucella]MDX4074941.1 GtrA family protein [Brucella sp. NBRC 113783]RLL73924.1 GtrA family protein [[Ochrobactrum] soli]